MLRFRFPPAVGKSGGNIEGSFPFQSHFELNCVPGCSRFWRVISRARLMYNHFGSRYKIKRRDRGQSYRRFRPRASLQRARRRLRRARPGVLRERLRRAQRRSAEPGRLPAGAVVRRLPVARWAPRRSKRPGSLQALASQFLRQQLRQQLRPLCKDSHTTGLDVVA